MNITYRYNTDIIQEETDGLTVLLQILRKFDKVPNKKQLWKRVLQMTNKKRKLQNRESYLSQAIYLINTVHAFCLSLVG